MLYLCKLKYSLKTIFYKLKSKNVIIQFLVYFLSNISIAQGVFAPLNSDYYHLIDRYEILQKSFAPNINTTFKATLRKDIASFADSLALDSTLKKSKSDEFNIQYLKNDNPEWYADSQKVGASKKSILKYFYTYKNAAFTVFEKNFQMQINPVFNFEQRTGNKDYFLSLNTRGIEVRGMIAKRIGFYTFLSDNQAFVPEYVQQEADTVSAVASNIAFPSENFTKTFKTKGYDFFSARGYFTFNIIKQIHVQFGHDKNFIGNGFRSLFLSDYSGKYLFLKLTTRVWKLHYTNLFAELTGDVVNQNKLNPRKYMAAHHLSLNIRKNFQIGLFETIIFDRDSSGGGFELNYLNPVILYREVESYLGSKDKTAVGLDFKWNFANRFSAYGQFSLHEFKLNELLSKRGWWGNKYAWQIGLKYINAFGVQNLDLQAEHNYVRPFVYADKSSLTAYTNYNQPLAHPQGANFYEFIGIARYQPFPKLTLTAKAFFITFGKDKIGENNGGDILKNYTTRTNEYGNSMAQGIRSNIFFVSFTASYMLKHNLFIDLRTTLRNETTAGNPNLNANYITLGLRYNIAQRSYEF